MNDKKTNQEQARMDAAWSRMEKAIAQEHKNPIWSLGKLELPSSVPLAHAVGNSALSGESEAKVGAVTETVKDERYAKRSAASSRWMKRNRKWAGGAVAACIVAAVLITPAADRALASVLNVFRMGQVTTVQADDLHKLFNSFVGDGKELETINKLGTFTRTNGVQRQEQATVQEAEKTLGRKLIVPKGWEKEQLQISPADTITFTMNVSEVNKAMRRMGATTLLPESIDGKPIKLEIGENVNMYHSSSDQSGVSFSQQPVPQIVVDPSIPVQEAIHAIMDFPLLPDYLKQGLKISDILKGQAPLPVVGHEQSHKVTIAGTVVMVSVDEKSKHFASTWVKDGQLYEYSGNGFINENAFQEKITELIKQ